MTWPDATRMLSNPVRLRSLADQLDVEMRRGSGRLPRVLDGSMFLDDPPPAAPPHTWAITFGTELVDELESRLERRLPARHHSGSWIYAGLGANTHPEIGENRQRNVAIQHAGATASGALLLLLADL